MDPLQEDPRRSPTGPSPSPGAGSADKTALKETGPNVTDVVLEEVVTPQDVAKLEETKALSTAVKVAAQGSRDLFEALVAGSMPALMPGQGYIKSGNRIVSVDYHAENGKFRDSAMPGGRWGSAAEARAQALPTLKRQEGERNTRRQQEVQAKNAALQAKNAALQDYVKKHYSNRIMSRPEQIDVEKEFDWVWDRRQADRKAAADWARGHEEKPGLPQEDWRAEWAERKKIELDAEKSAWKDYIGTLPETKRTKRDWHSLYMRWYDKTWSQR